MSKTDRQTDKATWWSVTAYGDEITVLQDNTKWPPEFKKVYGGTEECPTTKRIHFQGAIQLHKQQRMSWFKTWLPTAHLEVAKSKDALIKYAMKEDTAVGDKTEVSNSIKFYSAHEICVELMDVIYDDYRTLIDEEKDDKDYMFWKAVNRLLSKDIRLSGQLMNPTLKGWFRNTKYVWYEQVKKRREAAEESEADEIA